MAELEHNRKFYDMKMTELRDGIDQSTVMGDENSEYENRFENICRSNAGP